MPQTLLSLALLNLLLPTLTLPHISAITNTESAYCRSYSLLKSFSHSAGHHPLVQPSSAERPGPGSMRAITDLPITRRKPPQLRSRKTSRRGLAFIYFSRRKAALCGCGRVCVCQDNRKKDIGVELPGNSWPSARVESSFSLSFVLRGI